MNFYARDDGGFGVVMAIFFWIALSSAIVAWACRDVPGARRTAWLLS